MEALKPDDVIKKYPTSEYRDLLHTFPGMFQVISDMEKNINDLKNQITDLKYEINDLEDEKRLNNSENEKRLNDIEGKLFKKPDKKTATRAQKILLMNVTNMLPGLLGLPITLENKSIIVSEIINIAPDNIESDLSHISNTNSELRTEANYTHLAEFLKKVGLIEKAKEAELILEQIRSEKVNSKNK